MSRVKFDMSGKVILATGAVERVGRCVLLTAARAGADVAVTYCEGLGQEGFAESLIAEVEAMGRRCLVVPADNRKVSDLMHVMDEVERVYGRLDILVQNAGNVNVADIQGVTPEIWESSHDCCAKGPAFLTQRAAELMMKNGGGRIFWVAGDSYFGSDPEFIAHSNGKYSALRFGQTVAVEYAPYIQCNSIIPYVLLQPHGTTDDGGFTDHGSDAYLAVRGSAFHNLGGLYKDEVGREWRCGCPEFFTEFLLFLCECGSGVNGTAIPMDGGYGLMHFRSF